LKKFLLLDISVRGAKIEVSTIRHFCYFSIKKVSTIRNMAVSGSV